MSFERIHFFLCRLSCERVSSPVSFCLFLCHGGARCVRLVQWAPGGKGAHTILERFVQNGLRTFNTHRAKTDRESTSSLSPHVHFGEISTRHIFYMVGMQ